MREKLIIPVVNIRITSEETFLIQGAPREYRPTETILRLHDKAAEIFYRSAEPACVVSPVDTASFLSLYFRAVDNEVEAPLPDIVRASDHLALFILTLGEAVSAEVQRLFTEGKEDLAFTLDAVASAGSEHAAELLQDTLFTTLYDAGQVRAKKILRYSPGYCGWGIGGQREIFDFLKPDDIGVTLTKSLLMRPVKSLSGVMVAGNRSIHAFRNDYPFCALCKTKKCRDRILT